MLSRSYAVNFKALPDVLKAIRQGTAPDKFTVQYLKDLGFNSSNYRAVIPIFKDLGLLTDDGQPTPRYHDFRNESQSATVLAEAIKEAYSDIFTIREHPSESDKQAIQGKFKSYHNVTDHVADLQTGTFLSLVSVAKFDSKTQVKPKEKIPDEKPKTDSNGHEKPPFETPKQVNLRYNIEIHLPATNDIEVFNAIFKSLKEHILD